MREQCGHSMQHWEHMCSLTDNGCAAEKFRSTETYDCVPCDDHSQGHYWGCSSSYIAA